MIPTPCRMAGCTISIRPTYSCAHTLTYLHSWLGEYKTGNIPKLLNIERKLLLTAYIKSYMSFRLPPKCMTLNDLSARFRVTDSLSTAKMAKYSLVMTPTQRLVVGCITSIKPTYSCVRALTYLLTQLALCV